MKTLVDARLASEAARFGLRFACDDCVHFAPERERTCGHGWPIRLRRSVLDLADVGRAGERDGNEDREPIFFCKEFELA
jgi:hypothetical protein